MTNPLEKNYIESLRGWAQGVIADQVVTTPHSAAQVAVELLDHIKFLEGELNNSRLTHAGLAEITQTTYDEIWAIVGDGKGEWDYPAQIVRYTKYLKEKCVKLEGDHRVTS